MEQKNARGIQEALAKPFAPVDLEWRLQQTFSYQDTMRGIAVPYVTNRAIQNRLDEVVGSENWYNDYKPWHGTGKKDAQICGISIHFDGRGFITKWDGAEDSDIEPIKGGLSDSMKRAAVQWGIGRVLYNMDAVFVDVEKKGKSYVIKKSEQAKLDKAYLDMLNKLGLEPAPAGGLQPEFPPKSSAEDAPKQKQEASPAQAPQSSKPTTDRSTENTSEFNGPKMVTDENRGRTAPYEYKVLSSKVQRGMNNTNTLAELAPANGKPIQVFAKGEHPLLSPGVLLTGTRIITKQQDTVVFYVLEAYQVVQPQQAAA